MICPNQSNRGPLKEKKKLKCGSLPTADIVEAVGKKQYKSPKIYSLDRKVDQNTNKMRCKLSHVKSCRPGNQARKLRQITTGQIGNLDMHIAGNIVY